MIKSNVEYLADLRVKFLLRAFFQAWHEHTHRNRTLGHNKGECWSNVSHFLPVKSTAANHPTLRSYVNKHHIYDSKEATLAKKRNASRKSLLKFCCHLCYSNYKPFEYWKTRLLLDNRTCFIKQTNNAPLFRCKWHKRKKNILLLEEHFEDEGLALTK